MTRNACRLARRAQRRAARGGDARGRAAADPRGRGHGQDDDAVRARGVAAGARASRRSGSCCSPSRAARRARWSSARARSPSASRPTRAASSAARSTRSRTGWCALHASSLGLDAGLRRARRRRRGRSARLRAPGAGPRREPPALPARADDARHLLAHGQRADAARGGAGRVVPVVRGAPRGARGDRSAPTARASARSACSTSTTCCCTGARSRPTR